MTLNFRHFLQKRGVDIPLFIQNCTPEYHRWPSDRARYDVVHPSIHSLKQYEPDLWLQNAFLWEYSLQRGIEWYDINEEWEGLVLSTQYTKVIFGLDIPTQLYTRI